jgi:hypothetical protein
LRQEQVRRKDGAPPGYNNKRSEPQRLCQGGVRRRIRPSIRGLIARRPLIIYLESMNAVGG